MRGSKEDGYRDRDTTIADDGEQEAGHVFLQVTWTDTFRKQPGRSKVPRFLLVRTAFDVKPGGVAGGIFRPRADTPASIVQAIFL